MERITIMVVDDEKEILKQMEWALGETYRVITAESAPEAIAKVRSERPHLVTLDLGLMLHSDNDREGLEVLKELIGLDRLLKVLVVTANTQREVAMKAIQMGAYDYYCKPVNVNELRIIIKHALHIRALEEANEALQSRLEEAYTFDNIIGSCPAMESVFSMIRKVADTDVTVLIEGESGTGKELVAKAIHYRSSRRKGPFITINCGAIPENLLESEFFGHEKGAFTGAHIQRSGKFELAHGGTLFLDEVGEIPLMLQMKLLRFLQDRKIERIGGRTTIDLDVRILAASNKDLSQMKAAGTFREDLFFRLSVIDITLPPLREREGDIDLLARNFLTRFSRELNKDIKDFTREALLSMRGASWPGNVRELENKVKRGVIISQGPLVSSQDMGLDGDSLGPPLSLKDARRELDIKYINHALRRAGGNVSKAAKAMGISRVCLHDLIKKYAIR